MTHYIDHINQKTNKTTLNCIIWLRNYIQQFNLFMHYVPVADIVFVLTSRINLSFPRESKENIHPLSSSFVSLIWQITEYIQIFGRQCENGKPLHSIQKFPNSYFNKVLDDKNCNYSLCDDRDTQWKIALFNSDVCFVINEFLLHHA